MYTQSIFIVKEYIELKIVHTIAEARAIIKEWKKDGFSIGLVPTMGYLHEGHKSLIDKSAKDNDKTVVSIFVNPIQFGANEDLASYPRDLERDARVCESAGADLIFNPTPEEMYFPDFSTYIDAGDIQKELCGKSRPTHFRGVCTVVAKLLNIITPDRAYFGQKDAQQLAVVKRMVRDLSIDVEIVGCPIVRENDGLAKSSRNVYMNTEERQAAAVINRALKIGREMIEEGEYSSQKITEAIKEEIMKEQCTKIDYIQVVSYPSIKPIEKIEKPALVAAAVYVGKTRLIDNFIIK